MTRATMCVALVAISALVAAAALAVPPELIAYPAQGQTAEQQRKDEADCEQWARQKVAQANTAASAPAGAASAPAAPARPPQPPALPPLPSFPGLPPLPALPRPQLPPDAGAGPSTVHQRALAACMSGRGYSVK